MAAPDSPSFVGIEITGRCALRCRHCFNNSGPDVARELPFARIVKLLDEIRGWGLQRVRLSGGEPTMHRRFRGIVQACNARGIAVDLSTNGVYAPATLDWLASAPIARFLVSIDGDESTHDSIRGRGMYARALASCRRLTDANRAVTLVMHVARENRGAVAAVVARATEIGASVKLSPMRPLGRAADMALLTPADNLALVRDVHALRARHPRTVIAVDFDLFTGGAGCPALRSMINVESDGAILSCAFLPQFVAGNVFEMTLAEAWHTSRVFASLRGVGRSPACRVCGYARVCGGGCPALAYEVNGALDALDPTCFGPLLSAGGCT